MKNEILTNIRVVDKNDSCTAKEQFTTTEVTVTNYMDEWEYLNPKNSFSPQFFVL